MLLWVLTRPREAEPPVKGGDLPHSSELALAGKGTVCPSQGHRQPAFRWGDRAKAGHGGGRMLVPTDGGCGVGRAAVSMKSHSMCFVLTQLLWRKAEMCLFPSPGLAIWPPHRQRLRAIRTSPDQGRGRREVVCDAPTRGANKAWRPEHTGPERGACRLHQCHRPGAPSVLCIHTGRHQAQKSSQPAGPGRAWQALEPAGRRRLVSQDGTCRMSGGHLATPHDVSWCRPPPWALSFLLINREQRWV